MPRLRATPILNRLRLYLSRASDTLALNAEYARFRANAQSPYAQQPHAARPATLRRAESGVTMDARDSIISRLLGDGVRRMIIRCLRSPLIADLALARRTRLIADD